MATSRFQTWSHSCLNRRDQDLSSFLNAVSDFKHLYCGAELKMHGVCVRVHACVCVCVCVCVYVCDRTAASNSASKKSQIYLTLY